MTEVRTSSSGGKGLFATQTFSKGSLILMESPLVKLAPLDADESKSLSLNWFGSKKQSPSGNTAKSKDDSPTLWDAIAPPSSIATKGSSAQGTFRGMVQVGICWIHRGSSLKESEKESLLALYHPCDDDSASTLEKETVQLALEATKFIQDHLPKSSTNQEFQNWVELQKIMLIWVYNSFEGGRIYSQISRVNHDCNPTAVIQADGDLQRLVAATDIAVGDEISISYLGLLLYAETSVRRDKLRLTKYFDCQCQRCNESDDIAGRIPCPTCHPRELPQKSLDEDVQYDDDQAVNYVTIGGSAKCGGCKKVLKEDKKLQVVMKNVTSKVVSYLDSAAGTAKASASSSKGDEERDDEDEVLEEHLGLASTIMGDRHWTTNLLKLIHLDRRLALMSQAMLTTQEMPDMEDIAEAIDSLQRLERFVQSLDLKLDFGHVLGDIVIGVARTLVSLGDLKSQKYGAEWLEKIANYVEKFESEGRQKVVAALKVAWTKHDESKESPAKKKHKSS